MRILYVFPHPDDESFGPAPAIARQRREGHEVQLLTLTRGEATKQRHVLGYSLEEMAATRLEEMREVAGILDLSGMMVLEFPDGGLQDLDPRVLEQVVVREINAFRPHVIVTYAAHGISGHPDHLVTHAVVKRVFCATRETAPWLQRLAFFTLREHGRPGRPAHLKGSPAAAIDCIVRFEDVDRDRAAQALEAYRTYAEVVRAHDPLAEVAEGVYFEFFGESFDPPVESLVDGLTADD
ncbi:MAG TPA: PIG-L family deacetylase [Rhodothermales bacterium]